MRPSLRRWWFRSLATGMSCATLGGVGACRPYDCNDYVTCEPPPPCEPDPAVTPAEDRCGVFVSESLGTDESPGTRAQPVRSMERAVALAQAGPKRVYACAETFVQPLVLPSGVELWGGLDCSRDWNFLGADKKTILAPGPNMIPLRVEAGGGKSIVADVRADAADATTPSGSSIAVMVMPGAEIEILRGQLVAGRGAHGASGRDGGISSAAAGAPGANGGNACSADVVSGGAAVVTNCDGSDSVGGQGGPGNITLGGDGQDGEPMPVPNPQGNGIGGVGAGSAVECTIGEDGFSGADGEHGKGANGPGRLTLSGWEGVSGQDGGDGRPGQGGGGGGGSRGGSMLCGNNLVRGGAGGGSGGGGGCGGRGGSGGGYGGASIGLLSLGGHVAVRLTTIATGDGGDGGNGGLYQAGGMGGAAGLGGASFNMAAGGCRGGFGGYGGKGGHGGGGMGGWSLGIAHLLGQPVTQEGVTIQTGMPGHGGLGGNPDVPDSKGDDGLRADMLAFPQ